MDFFNKVLILLLFVFYASGVRVEAQTGIKNIRELYYLASKDSKVAEKFYKIVSTADTLTPVLLGYKGMAEFMISYHSYNPYIKLSYFNEGKQSLNKAVSYQPGNVELRFLRFTVQANAPFFLVYNNEIKEDKKIIYSALKSTVLPKKDRDLYERIFEFVIASDLFNVEEKNLLKSLYIKE